MTSEEKVEALGDALIDAIQDFTDKTKMTTGEVMDTLFSLFVTTAQTSPAYDPVQLAREINDRVRELEL
jgi:hypothetical protein